MTNPFETNLKGVKVGNSGRMPGLESRTPLSLEERYNNNLSIFSNIDKEYDGLNESIDKLDKAGLLESIEREKKEIEDRVNKKTTGEKIAQWTGIASSLASAAGAFVSMKGAKNVAAAGQALSQTTDYSKLSDSELTSKLNEYNKKKNDAQKIIDDQTKISKEQQIIIDDIKAGKHAKCVELQGLEENLAKLDLEKGDDPLVVTYKETTAHLAEANKGAEGSLQECKDLKSANDALETAKTTKLYKDQTDPTTGKVTKVEDTEAEQREIKKAQEEVKEKQKALDAKKTALEKQQTNDLQKINQERTERESKVKAKKEDITKTRSDAQKKNGEACTKIGNSTDIINDADAQIKLIQTEQSKRSVKKK